MSEEIISIRERAKIEETWCSIKHMLCAEEHLLETVQKLAREKYECEERGDKESALQKLEQIVVLSEIADRIRFLRQRTVDVAFAFISESKLREILLEVLSDPERLKSIVGEEKLGELIRRLNEYVQKEASGEEGSGEDPREEDLFKEFKECIPKE